MKKEVLIILILFLLPIKVSAIAISPAKFEFDFVPELTRELEVTIVNSNQYPINATLSFGGDLSQYILYNSTIIELNVSGFSKQKFVLKLPKKIGTPGENLIGITAAEVINPLAGGIAVGTAVESQIKINVPYPEKFVSMQFLAENVNENETVDFEIKVKNKGILKINNLEAFVEVSDELNLIKKLKSEKYFLESNEEKTIPLKLRTIGLSPGKYYAKAYVVYDNINSKASSEEFRIGTQDIKLNNYTNILSFNQINKAIFILENLWNTKIDKIYGIVKLKKNGKQALEVKTNEVLIGPFGTNELVAYLDTSGLESGNYQSEFAVYFSDRNKKFELEQIIETAPKKIEKKQYNTILITLIIIIVLFDIIRIIKNKRKKKREILDFKEELDF